MAFDADSLLAIAKTVLLLADHFPPIGGAGAQRAVNLVRHLPALGWVPIVVTSSGGARDFWSPNDPALERELPADLRVERVTTPHTPRVQARLERLLALPRSFGRNFAEQAAAVSADLRSRVDVLLCEFGSYNLAQSAIRLSGDLGIPWVADLQDPWALDEMWLYPTDLHRRIDLRRMRRTLADASAVIMNTPEAAARVRRAFTELNGAPSSPSRTASALRTSLIRHTRGRTVRSGSSTPAHSIRNRHSRTAPGMVAPKLGRQARAGCRHSHALARVPS